jgi:Helix-turn-helix domain
MAEKNWLTPKEVTYEYGFSIRTLEYWRKTGYGPRFAKVGRKILYSRSAIEEWLASKDYGSTSGYPGGSNSMGWIGLVGHMH